MGNQVEPFAQMGLHNAGADHQAQREVAKLRTRKTANEPLYVIQLTAGSQRPEHDNLSHDDRSNAAQKLWAMGPVPSGFEYGKRQLTTESRGRSGRA